MLEPKNGIYQIFTLVTDFTFCASVQLYPIYKTDLFPLKKDWNRISNAHLGREVSGHIKHEIRYNTSKVMSMCNKNRLVGLKESCFAPK